jgi:phage terminase small subunit
MSEGEENATSLDEAAVAFANMVKGDVEEDIYNTQIKTLLEEEETCTRQTMSFHAKLEQLRSDQEEANTYLNKKIEDNYVKIAELEDQIIKEQEDRRLKEVSYASVRQATKSLSF